MQLFRVLVFIVSIGFLAAIVDLVRRGVLKEKYAVLWITAILAVSVLSFWQGLLDTIAAWLGVGYPPSLLFIAALIFILLILLHYSVSISTLSERNKSLTQEITLLRGRIEALEEGKRREK